MLDQKTIEVIKSTVPVLEIHGEQITTRFYEMMFTNHPELLNIFNHANQKQGKQQKALANTVYAAAANIDRLEEILPAVLQIAHKHRSLGVKPEHYPIVGEHLLRAIKEVLGDAATDEIMDAWEKAYNVIAAAFIGIEKDLYTEVQNHDAGWSDFKDFVVSKKVQESILITSFYLTPVKGGKLIPFKPGQYISLRLQLPNEPYTQIRQYSLSQPSQSDFYRISVKKEPGLLNKPSGKISNYLHDEISVGDVLQVSAPAGDFHFTAEDKPVAFISGGVGITPMIAMLHEAMKHNQPISFIHSAKNSNVQAFHRELSELASKSNQLSYYNAYTDPTNEDYTYNSFSKAGKINEEDLLKWLPSTDIVVYMCGPISFMENIYQSLIKIGVSVDNIKYEFFGPSAQLT